MAVLVQPNRHAPAIQIETLNDSSNRTTFLEKNDFISDESLLLRADLCQHNCDFWWLILQRETG